jgi:hypothetical protein
MGSFKEEYLELKTLNILNNYFAVEQADTPGGVVG